MALDYLEILLGGFPHYQSHNDSIKPYHCQDLLPRTPISRNQQSVITRARTHRRKETAEPRKLNRLRTTAAPAGPGPGIHSSQNLAAD